MTMLSFASDVAPVTKPITARQHAPSKERQGVMNPHNGTKRPPYTMREYGTNEARDGLRGESPMVTELP